MTLRDNLTAAELLANPRLIICLVFTSRSTMKVYDPTAAPGVAFAVSTASSDETAVAASKTREMRNFWAADLRALSRELISR